MGSSTIEECAAACVSTYGEMVVGVEYASSESECYCQDKCDCWHEEDGSISWIYADVDFTTMEICEGKKQNFFNWTKNMKI